MLVEKSEPDYYIYYCNFLKNKISELESILLTGVVEDMCHYKIIRNSLDLMNETLEKYQELHKFIEG